MWHDIEKALQDAEKSLAEYKKWNKEYAKREHKYRVALSQRLVQRRVEGCPATILSDVVRGEEDIAKLKENRDIAEGLMKSAEKGTDFYKLLARLLDSQFSKEYGSPTAGFGG